jgi:DNA-binding transcriptional MerR regulator
MQQQEEKSFFTISEVAQITGTTPSLLRFWEKEFKQIKPKTSNKGHRRYTQDDIDTIKHIYFLTKEKGLTLEGVKMALKDTNKTSDKTQMLENLIQLRDFLESLRSKL